MRLEEDFQKSPRSRNYGGHLFKIQIPRSQLYSIESESQGSGLRNTDWAAAMVVPHTREPGASGAGSGGGLASITAGQGAAHSPGGQKVPSSPRELFRGAVQVTQSFRDGT